MIRRAFRFGLRLGLLIAVCIALVKLLRARDDDLLTTPEPLASPTPWPPLAEREPPASTPATATLAAWVDPDGKICPTTHPVKAKLSSQIFHVEGGRNYERTIPDRCYRDPAAAEADGLRQSKT